MLIKKQIPNFKIFRLIGFIKPLLLIVFCLLLFCIFSGKQHSYAFAAGEYNQNDFSLNTVPKTETYNATGIPYETSIYYQGQVFTDYTVSYVNDTYIETETPPQNVGVYTVIIRINNSEIFWETSLTITPKPITIEYGGASSYQYFGVEFSRSISPIGVINDEEIGLSFQYIGTKETLEPNVKPINADSYEIEITITNNNYSITQHTGNNPRELTIIKASLSAKAEDVMINEGETPEFLVTITGFVSNEDEEVLISLPQVICEENEPGDYSIIPTGGAANNYSINYFPGTLTINKIDVEADTDDGLHVFSIEGVFNPSYNLIVNSISAEESVYTTAMSIIETRGMYTYMDKVLYSFDTSESEGYSTSSRYKLKISNIVLQKIFSYKILVVDEVGLVYEITKYNYTNGTLSFSSDKLGTIFIVERQLRTYLGLGIVAGLTLVIIAFLILTKLKYQIDKREIERQNKEVKAEKNKYRWD